MSWNLSEYRKKKRAYLAQMPHSNSTVTLKERVHLMRRTDGEGESTGASGAKTETPNNLQAQVKWRHLHQTSVFQPTCLHAVAFVSSKKDTSFRLSFPQRLPQQKENVTSPHWRPCRKLLPRVLSVPELRACLGFPMGALLSLSTTSLITEPRKAHHKLSPE